MNILILNWRDITHPKAGGAERVTMEHAKAWVKMGHSVIFFTSWHSNALSNEETDGITILRRGGSMTVYIAAAIYLITHSQSYDVIVDEIHALPFFSFFVFNHHVVAFIHEVAGDIWDSMFIFPFNRIGKFIEPWLLKIYGMRRIPFWTDSDSMVDELVSLGIKKECCTAIPCPITNAIPHVWEKKEKNPSYIFVSRVVPMKGIEEVIKAFNIILLKQPDATLHIVGGGEDSYINQLRKMILELKIDTHVHFHGKVSEEQKLSLMGKSHILLHASIKEGWGLVVLEAASQGTPAVVYNVAGLRDVVKNGKTGIVVNNNNPQALAEAASELFENRTEYKEFQKQGMVWVESLKWKDVTKQSLDLLKKVAR